MALKCNINNFAILAPCTIDELNCIYENRSCLTNLTNTTSLIRGGFSAVPVMKYKCFMYINPKSPYCNELGHYWITSSNTEMSRCNSHMYNFYTIKHNVYKSSEY